MTMAMYIGLIANYKFGLSSQTCMRCTCNDKINVVWVAGLGMYPVVSDAYGLGGGGLFGSAALFKTKNVFINKQMVHVRAHIVSQGSKFKC